MDVASDDGLEVANENEGMDQDYRLLIRSRGWSSIIHSRKSRKNASGPPD